MQITGSEQLVDRMQYGQPERKICTTLRPCGLASLLAGGSLPASHSTPRSPELLYNYCRYTPTTRPLSVRSLSSSQFSSDSHVQKLGRKSRARDHQPTPTPDLNENRCLATRKKRNCPKKPEFCFGLKRLLRRRGQSLKVT